MAPVRAATDIANSGIPVKVGMVLTAQKTATRLPVANARDVVDELLLFEVLLAEQRGQGVANVEHAD